MSEQSEFSAQGSLLRPGLLGRLTRLVFGLICAGFVWMVLAIGPIRLVQQFADVQGFWPWAITAFYLFPYVINIGFGRSWGPWPRYWVLAGVVGFASLSYFSSGQILGPWLIGFLLLWMFYVFLHLAVSFLAAGILATPGCEMRALPYLYGKLSGRPVREHSCPVGPLAAIDRWESRKHRSGRDA